MCIQRGVMRALDKGFVVRIARGSGDRAGTTVTLGKMRRPGILSLVTIAAGLSALAVGCTHGIAHSQGAMCRRLAQPSDRVEASENPSNGESTSIASAAELDASATQDARPMSVEQCPAFRNIAEAIWTEDFGSAPVLAQFTEVKFPEPEVVPPPQGVPSEKKRGGPKSVASPSGGPAITLHADNLDIRKALEMVSRQANMNILVSPGVKRHGHAGYSREDGGRRSASHRHAVPLGNPA